MDTDSSADEIVQEAVSRADRALAFSEFDDHQDGVMFALRSEDMEIEANSKTDVDNGGSISMSRSHMVAAEELHSDSSEEEHEFVYGDRGLRVGGNQGPNYSVRQSIDIIDRALGFQSDSAEVRLKLRGREQTKRPVLSTEEQGRKRQQTQAALLEAATDDISMQVQNQLRLIDNEITKAHPGTIDATNDPPSSPANRLARRESIFEDANISSDSDDGRLHSEIRGATTTSSADDTSNRRNGVVVPKAFNAPRAVIHIDVSDDSDEDVDVDEAGLMPPSIGKKSVALKRQTTPAIRTVARHSVIGGDSIDVNQELHPLGEVQIEDVQASRTVSGVAPRRAITLDLSSSSEEDVKKKKGRVIKEHNIQFDVSDSD